MIVLNNIQEDGCVFRFFYYGESVINVKILIIDGYSKLIFDKLSLDLLPDNNHFVQTPVNVKHKIYTILNEDETKVLFSIENFDGKIEVSDFDKNGYYKDIGKNNINFSKLACPLYDITINRIYDIKNCCVKKNDVVFDIGANVGLFTYDAVYRGAKTVYSFEPITELSNILKKNNIKNVKVENVAVSNENKIDNLYVDVSGISCCLKNLNKNRSTDKLMPVKTINVMDYIFNNDVSRIDLLKMDCEGSEYDIIDSLESSYMKFNIDRILFEYHYLEDPIYRDRYKKSLEKIKKCGFKTFTENDSTDSIGLIACWK